VGPDCAGPDRTCTLGSYPSYLSSSYLSLLYLSSPSLLSVTAPKVLFLPLLVVIPSILFLPNLTVLSPSLLDPKSLSSPDLTFPPPLVLSPPRAIFHNCRPIVWAQSMIWPSHCAKCRCRFIQSKSSSVVGYCYRIDLYVSNTGCYKNLFFILTICIYVHLKGSHLD
jgi:hypothetical protein